ncbi:SPOR domain-containing protein, partial [Thermodesulfobacteriota bacterium]
MYLTKIFHLHFGNSSKGICLSILLIPLVILFSSSNAEGFDRSYYSIHIASHKILPNADKEILQLKKKGYDAFHRKVDILDKGEWYRLFIGRFGNKEKALAFAKELKASGFSKYSTVKELIEVVTIGVIDTRKILRESKAAKTANAAYLEILKAKRA